jgi:cation transport ATPase
MSSAERGLRRLRRRHRLIRDEVDAMRWPHPRPAADERIVCLNLCFIWVAVVQAVYGPPPNSVQGATFDHVTTIAFSVLMIVCSCLVLYAAWCKSQYVSFGIEMAGTVGFSGVFAIYTFAAVVGITDWFATQTAAFATGLFLGNLLRAQKLIRRLW